MKFSEAIKQNHIWIAEDVYTFAEMCRQKRPTMSEEEYRMYFKSRAVILAEEFHVRKSNVCLGLVSKKAAKLKASKRTAEHVSSRHRAAEKTLKRVIERPNISFERVIREVVTACKIVWTTNKENKNLERERKQHLSNGNKTIPWRYMNKIAKVNLIAKDPYEYRKSYYMIEGTKYESATVAGKLYGISPSEVDSRALNKNSYPEWQKFCLKTGERIFRKQTPYKSKNGAAKNNKCVYNIENIEYNQPKNILQKYGIDYSTLASRCKSKKWSDWHQIRKEAA